MTSVGRTGRSLFPADFHRRFLFHALSYALLQVAYNLQLKHTVILDVIAIAMGFILRAFAGAAATGIMLSAWFLLCTAMLALFLGIEKRKAELRLSDLKGKKSRAVLHRYTLPLLSRMESVVTNGTIVTYALWSAGPIVKGASTSWMMLTLPFVLYGIFRYLYLIHIKGEGGAPDELVLTDRPLQITFALWGLAAVAVLYLSKHV